MSNGKQSSGGPANAGAAVSAAANTKKAAQPFNRAAGRFNRLARGFSRAILNSFMNPSCTTRRRPDRFVNVRLRLPSYITYTKVFMDGRLGTFEQLLLLALLRLGDDSYGVPIREDIERRTGRVVSPGAIFTALDRLEG